MNAAQIVDLIDPAEALTWGCRVIGVIVGTTHMDAFGWAHCCTQFTTDALLHAVLIAIEHMAPVQTLGFINFFVHGCGIALVAFEQPSA